MQVREQKDRYNFLLSFLLYRKFKTKIKRTIQKTWHIDVKNLRIK